MGRDVSPGHQRGAVARTTRPAAVAAAIAAAATLAVASVAAWVANLGTVAVAPDAAMEGESGLRVAVDGGAGPGQRAFLVDDSPAGEPTYRAVFWLDVNGLAMAPGDSFVLFEGMVPNGGAGPRQVPAFRLHLRKAARPAPRLVGELFAADRASAFAPAVPVPARGARRIQVEWRAATGGAREGLLRVTLLGSRPRRVTAPAVDNTGHRLQSVRLGAVADVDAGSRGAFYLDGFESYRTLAP
jgi:hypothetical protein